jgi:uncharacterized protein YdeI (YjbR/CyaY-like superfamily)
VEEKIKWGFPHFDYRGEMMCSMAAFKQHATMGFWKASLMSDKSLIKNAEQEASMGHVGPIKQLSDLPSDKKIIAYIKEAMQLNELGIKVPAKPKNKERTPLTIPPSLATALSKNKAAKLNFEKFSYSHQKEYVQWIAEAKQEATQQRRVEQAIQQLAEGKSRNYKYEKK